ncbi:hypothetical protein CVT26_010737 [Gymnopilus dilepis]|uniref:Uncharacterized protein n=1 Tax=Gymnopilus dilepis TaxID=231916 RepID=A0A409Y0U5_9AGAR|nr:hypothetical protein CVT26_010737 [Gymnopilus dilepis]
MPEVGGDIFAKTSIFRGGKLKNRDAAKTGCKGPGVKTTLLEILDGLPGSTSKLTFRHPARLWAATVLSTLPSRAPQAGDAHESWSSPPRLTSFLPFLTLSAGSDWVQITITSSVGSSKAGADFVGIVPHRPQPYISESVPWFGVQSRF